MSEILGSEEYFIDEIWEDGKRFIQVPEDGEMTRGGILILTPDDPRHSTPLEELL